MGSNKSLPYYGYKRDFGIGFIVKKSRKIKDGKGNIITEFTEVELVEVSMISDNEPIKEVNK